MVGGRAVTGADGRDPHEFVPSERIGSETSLLCATSVPLHGCPDRHLGDSQYAQHGRAFWDTAKGPCERVSVGMALVAQ